mmetsp:Transcript_27435/g.66738  ORF Transcript_27435/g.66738 Transcript_27435/m.66738 type:complete len:89 (+) Transcript_27435:1329-1595(+)
MGRCLAIASKPVREGIGKRDTGTLPRPSPRKDRLPFRDPPAPGARLLVKRRRRNVQVEGRKRKKRRWAFEVCGLVGGSRVMRGGGGGG